MKKKTKKVTTPKRPSQSKINAVLKLLTYQELTALRAELGKAFLKSGIEAPFSGPKWDETPKNEGKVG